MLGSEGKRETFDSSRDDKRVTFDSSRDSLNSAKTEEYFINDETNGRVTSYRYDRPHSTATNRPISTIPSDNDEYVRRAGRDTNFSVDTEYEKTSDKLLPPDNLVPQRRSCLWRWKWCFAFLFVIIAALLIVYFVVFPDMLKKKAANIHDPDITLIAVSGIRSDGFILKTSTMAHYAPGTLPLRWDIARFPASAWTSDGKEIAKLTIEPIQFWGNQKFAMNLEFHFTFSELHVSNLQSIIREFSKSGYDDVNLVLKANLPVTINGIFLYSGIPVQKILPLSGLFPNTHSISKLLPPRLKQPHATGEELRKMRNPLDIIHPSEGVYLAWDSFELIMRDEGPRIKMGIAFENPVRQSLERLDQLSLFIALERLNILKISVTNLPNKNGTNGISLGAQELDMIIDLDFIAPGIDESNLSKGIEMATKSYAEKSSYALGIQGPIIFKGMDFVQEITRDFYADFLVGHENFEPDNILEEDTPRNSKDHKNQNPLGSSSVDLVILPDSIKAFLGLKLPRNLPLPQKIDFPYSVSFSILASAQKVFDFRFDPFTIQTTRESITSKFGAHLDAVNTEAAAVALASVINPILANKPKASAVGLKKFLISSSEGKTFKWVQNLFREKDELVISLPPICKECLLNSKSSMNLPMTQLLKPKVFDLSQSSRFSGFSFKGSADVAYPSGLPSVTVDVGYVHTSIGIDGSGLADIDLPIGFKYKPGGTADLAVDLMFNKRPNIAGIQNMLDSVLIGKQIDASLSIGNFMLGSSPSKKIVTFSKINLELPSSAFLKTKRSKSVLALPTLKIQDLDFAINSETQLSASISSIISLPVSIPRFHLGLANLNLDLLVDSDNLSTVSLGGIQVNSQVSPLKIDLKLNLAKGNPKLNKNVAELVNAVTHQDQNSNLLVGVSGFQLSSGAAVLDQFKELKINLPLGKLLKSKASSGSSFDITALKPLGSLPTVFKPALKYILVDATPENALLLGGDASYVNPLPVSFKIGYFSFKIAASNAEILRAAISGAELVRKQGIVKLRIDSRFPAEANPLAFLLEEFSKGEIKSQISVTDIRFGTSAANQNDLLSLINLDLTDYASKSLASKSREISQKLNDATHKVGALDPGSASSSGLNPILNALEIDFKPQSLVTALLEAQIKMPILADIKIPYISISLDLAKDRDALRNPNSMVKFFTLEVQGLDVSGPLDSQQLKLQNSIQFYESEALNDNVASISDSIRHPEVPANGIISIGNLKIGKSSTQFIGMLSKLHLPIEISKILKLVSQKAPKPDSPPKPAEPSKGISPTLENIKVVAGPLRTLQVSLVAGFTNNLKLKLNGLGFVRAKLGIDNVEFIDYSAQDISVKHGVNSLNLVQSLQFASGDKLKAKIALFVDHIRKSGLGETKEVFNLNGLRLGNSQSDHLKFLDAIAVDIPSAILIGKLAKDSEQVSKVEEWQPPQLQVAKLHLDSKADSYDLDTVINIVGLAFPIEADIGKFGANVVLQNEEY